MSKQTTTIYNVITISFDKRRNVIESPETVEVRGMGQEAAREVDKKYKRTFFRKVLLGWILPDATFLPLELPVKIFK
jgi:hypothetical protein